MDQALGNEALLPLNRYLGFWSSMNASNASAFTDVLLKALIASEKKNPEKEKALSAIFDRMKILLADSAVDSRLAAGFIKQGLTNTLMYMALAKPIQGLESLAAFSKSRNEKSTDAQFLEMMTRMLSSPQIQVMDIETLIDCSLSIKCFRGSECPLPPPEELLDLNSVSKSLIVPFLVECYCCGDYSQLLLDALAMSLKSQPAENTLMAILHFIRQLLTLRPVREPAVLKRLSMAVQPFYLWTLPHGFAAKQTLIFLSQEAKVPGYGRLMITNKFVAPSSPGHQQQPSLPEARMLHVYLSLNSRNGAFFSNLCTAMNSYAQTASTASYSFWMDLLIVYLSSIATLPSDWTNIVLTLRKTRNIAVETVVKLVTQTEEIMHSAMAMEDDACRGHLSSTCVPIVDKLKELAASAETHAEIPSPSIFARPRDSSTGTFEYLPQVGFSRIEVLGLEHENLREETVGKGKYVTTNGMDHLAVLLSKYVGDQAHSSSSGDPGLRPTARCVIGGDDAAVHNFVCSYVALRQTQGVLFSYCNLAVYLIPLGTNNHLANYLAAYDGWYARHVFTPFASPLNFVPQVHKPLEECSNGDITKSPLGAMNRLVQSYITDAAQVLSLNIYDCECWNQGSDAELSLFHTIPFAQRIEIGFYSSAKEAKGKRTSYYEMKEDKGVKLPAMDLKITYTMMNILGVPRQKSTVESKPFYVIVLSNVPRVGERATLANPAAEWLEMYTLDTDPQVVKKKKNKLFGDMDYGRTHHVAHVEIETNNRAMPFEVLIDGEVFGPYHKLRVTPSKIPGSSETISLPIHHFLPLDI